MRCYHKLVGGRWVPTPGEAGESGRGGRNIDTAIGRRSIGIMAKAEQQGRSLTSREQRHLDRLDRLALRREAMLGSAKAAQPAPKTEGARAVKPGESMGPAYDKRGRYNPARDPNVKNLAAVRAEVRTKRERSRKRA